MFVAGYHECRGISCHYVVCEDGVEKLGHISDILLEDAAIHHEHNGSVAQRRSENQWKTSQTLNQELDMVFSERLAAGSPDKWLNVYLHGPVWMS